MGQCYSINMRYKFKSGGASRAAVKSARETFVKQGFDADFTDKLTNFTALVHSVFCCTNIRCNSSVEWWIAVPAKRPIRKGEYHYTEHKSVKTTAAERKTSNAWYKTVEVPMVMRKRDAEGFGGIIAGFDASYSWESVVCDFFKTIAPYLVAGSSLRLSADECSYTLKVTKSGGVRWE